MWIFISHRQQVYETSTIVILLLLRTDYTLKIYFSVNCGRIELHRAISLNFSDSHWRNASIISIIYLCAPSIYLFVGGSWWRTVCQTLIVWIFPSKTYPWSEHPYHSQYFWIHPSTSPCMGQIASQTSQHDIHLRLK